MRQFGRYAELVLPGMALRSDNLTFEFRVPFDDDAEPNESQVTVYNLSADTRNRIKRKMKATLNVGYQEDVGTILNGYVTKVETDTTGADRATTIYILDSPPLEGKKMEEKTYKKNVTARQIIGDLVPKLGLTIGEIRLPKNYVYAKGYTTEEAIVDTLSAVAEDCGAVFYVNKGRVYIRPLSAGDNTRFILSPQTGLIGSPEYFEEEGDEDRPTVKGYKVECLLQHRITTASLIQIDSKATKGSFRVRSGEHSWTGNSFKTTMEAIQ